MPKEMHKGKKKGRGTKRLKLNDAGNWKDKKVRNIRLSKSLFRIAKAEKNEGARKKAERVKWCGARVNFVEAGGRVHFKGSRSCHVTLCPLCQWRRMISTLSCLNEAMSSVMSSKKGYRAIFLTLTVKNCKVDELAAAVTILSSGWSRLSIDRSFKPVVKGWFRSLEITFNKDRDEFHPHIHAILLVEEKEYFEKRYIPQSEWLSIWRRVASLDYDPVVDVRVVKGRERDASSCRKAILEVCKYTVKADEILCHEKKTVDRLVEALVGGLYHRRLTACGGVIKDAYNKASKKFKSREDPLIKINETLSLAFVRFRWNFGCVCYEREEVEIPVGEYRTDYVFEDYRQILEAIQEDERYHQDEEIIST
jgi:plasmid rolling circle replication initiator protein Rep